MRSTAHAAQPDAIDPNVKFVDHAPITFPRSFLWNHAAIVPTLPDHPVAWDRPRTVANPIIAGKDRTVPMPIVTAIDSTIPIITLRRGPSLVPIADARNWPSAYAIR